MRSILVLLLFWACSCFYLPTCALAAHGTQPIVSASEIDYPPFSVLNNEQQADGFSVALLRAALKEMGRDVIFTIGPWAEVKQSLVDGKTQVLPLVGRTPEREALFDFTFPYLTMHGTLVVRADDEKINSLADLKGKKVAVMQGDNAEEFARRSHLDASIIPTPTFVDALQGLADGSYDAVIIQKLLFSQLSKNHRFDTLKTIGGPLSDFKQVFCFAVRKDDHALLQLLNEGLSIVLANGTFDHLYKTWITPLEKSSGEKSRIVVGGDSNFPPYEYLDENGQPAGYNVELTKAIARQMGLLVEIRLKPWQQIRQEAANGSIDIIQGMYYSVDRDSQFDFSPAHTNVSYVAVARKGALLPKTLVDLDGKSVAVMAGDIAHDLIAARGKTRQLVTAQSQEEALEQVASGQCEYALVARIPALYSIRKHGWDDLIAGDTTLLAPEYCYATRHGSGQLLALFSEGLSSLQGSGEYHKIYDHTLGNYERSNRTMLKYLRMVSAILLVLFIGALLWTRSLRQQVRIRTANLEKEIAERKKLMSQIMKREQTINLLLNSTAEGIYGVDADGFCIFFNKAAQNLLGYDERRMIGRPLHTILAHTDATGAGLDETSCLVKQVLASRQPSHNPDAIFWKQDGDWINVEYFVHPVLNEGVIEGAVVTFSDISEKKKIEEQRIRSAQMSSLGELAAGIAHEINNPVGGVINYAQILLNKHEKTDMEKTLLSNIIKEGNRIAAIVNNLLNFVHKDRNAFKAVNLDEIIHEPMTLVQQQLTNDGIFVDIETGKDLPQIFGNAQKLEQVLLNLISNARHTLNAKYPGTDPNKILRISAEATGGKEDQSVLLIVWDQGQGISPQNLHRIFNRFYTTKPAGVGTGLGLSIVHDIIEEHGARIEIDSEEGFYTKVSIEFPVYRETRPV
jgi:two-component system sensor histidine kinase EvgS